MSAFASLGRWLPGKRSHAVGCLGGVEVITPSELTGWLFHAEHELHEVRLLLGNQLITAAPINIDRPDVSEHLGRSGQFGFRLEIPDGLSMHGDHEHPRLVALNTDGSFSCSVKLNAGQASSTARLLRCALDPELRGLRGHFDGLSSDEKELQGWCYSNVLGTATVWLHAQGLMPRAVRCTVHRPGMSATGHPDACGFSLSLQAWPEAAGALVWASFDEAGELRLPPMTPVRLPVPQPSTSALVMLPTDREEDFQLLQSEGLTTHSSGLSEDVSADYQAHWQALEEFRELIDRLELQVSQAEALDYLESLPPLLSPAPRKRRSALFRLWR